MPKISVIIPVYNASSFISKCIKSVLNQTYNDFELILINDGSTDNTLNICNTFAKNDSRIIIISKKNEGVSIARNIGIDNSSGDYITFIDADDYIEKFHLENLIVNSDSDFVFTGYKNYGKSKCDFQITRNYRQDSKTFVKDLLVEYDERSDTSCGLQYPWAKLYKNSIIQQYHLRFPVGMKYGEDTCFVWNYLIHCKTVYCKAGGTYRYFISGLSPKYKLSLVEFDTHINIYRHSLQNLNNFASYNSTKYLVFIKCDYFQQFTNYCSSFGIKDFVVFFKQFNLSYKKEIVDSYKIRYGNKQSMKISWFLEHLILYYIYCRLLKFKHFLKRAYVEHC